MQHSVSLAERARTPAPELQARYAELNRELFDGKLPTIPIFWGTMTTMGGKVVFTLKYDAHNPDPSLVAGGRRSKRYGYRLDMNSVHMVLTDVYKRDTASLDGLLVHEMIHVWFLTVDVDYDENHGYKFQRKMRELQAKVTFPITIDDKVSALDVADHIKQKPVNLVWGTAYSGEPIFQFLPDKYGRDAHVTSTVHTTLQYQVDLSRIKPDVKVLTMNSPAWNKVRLASSIPRVYKPGYFIRKNLPVKYPEATREAEAATPVWTPEPTRPAAE